MSLTHASEDIEKKKVRSKHIVEPYSGRQIDVWRKTAANLSKGPTLPTSIRLKCRKWYKIMVSPAQTAYCTTGPGYTGTVFPGVSVQEKEQTDDRD